MVRSPLDRVNAHVRNPRDPRIGSRRRPRGRVLRRSEPSDDDPSTGKPSRLSLIIKRKKERVERLVNELGEESLEDRLSTAVMQGAGEDGFRFSQLIASVGMRRGGPLTIFEVARVDSFETSDDLAERAKRLVESGADAIAVRLDEEASPEGLRDLFVVSRAVAANVPVFARDWWVLACTPTDWLVHSLTHSLANSLTHSPTRSPTHSLARYLHPLQIVDAKAAGATGVIGIVASVTQRGSSVLSSFGAALGLDCPVEVVNLNELKAMEGLGVPFYAMDIGVGISVGIAGFSRQLISGVLGNMDFNALSIVGLSSMEELHGKIATKADALYVKSGVVKKADGDELVRAILDACSGDD